jgi:hypothetical protein
VATNVAPTEAHVASAGHLNLHQAAFETAKSTVILIVKEAQSIMTAQLDGVLSPCTY